MAYIQKNIPPANKTNSFALMDMGGGLNNRSNELKDNQASSLKNMRFYNDRVMEKRYGSKIIAEAHNTMNFPIRFIDEFRPYNEDDVLVYSDLETLYIGNDSFTGLDTQIPLDAVNFNGKYFFVNGYYLYVYGKFPTVDTTYEKVIGTPPSGYVRLQVTNPPSGYTPLDASNTRGVTRYDYTNGLVWYEPCDNEVKDPYLGANVLPQNPSMIESLHGRLFVSGSNKDDDNVFLTNAGNPYYFAVSLPLQVPPNSDKVRGICVYDDAVLVGRGDDLFSITGITNNPDLGLEMFQIRKLNSHTGFANNRCMNHVHNYLFFVGSDGNMYAMSSARQDSKILSTTLINETLDMRKAPYNATEYDIGEVYTLFFEDEWYVSFPSLIVTSIYNYRLKAWTAWEDLAMHGLYNLSHRLIWGDLDGKMHEVDKENWLDNGTPYEAYWTSKNFDFGLPSHYKQFREFYVEAECYDDTPSTIFVDFNLDYDEVKQTTLIANQIARYGRAHFGDRFITKNIRASIPFILGRRSRHFQVMVRSGYEKLIYGETLEGLPVTDIPQYTLAYFMATNQYYVFERSTWTELAQSDINQPMRVFSVNGEYELRGRR